MEKCKFCQAELAENGTFCPVCGADNAEEVITAPEAEEITVEPPMEEAPAGEKKSATPTKIAMAVALVVVLIGALIALIGGGMAAKNSTDETVAPPTEMVEVEATHPADGNPDDATCKGTYTVTDEEAAAARETIVATIGDSQLTNGQLQVYYWSFVNNFLSSEYGYYMMMYGAMDYTKPLDVQFSVSDENLTWQQYFLQEALRSWNLNEALAQESAKAGYSFTEEQLAYLDNLPASLEETAAQYSMTVEELMLHNIGPGAGVEEFIQLQELSLAGQEYYQAQIDAMVPTQEDLEAFFAEHEEEYLSSGITKDATYVDVRHILIQVQGGTTDEQGNTTYSDEEWETCRAEAQSVLDAWLAGDATEDSFAALANEKSQDPGSNTVGGLYENVYVGQMVAPFEEWCFDETREYGNYGLVQTSYGYHVMFYVGSEPAWISYAESDWTNEKTNAMMDALTEAYPMEVDYSKIVLGFIDLGA